MFLLFRASKPLSYNKRKIDLRTKNKCSYKKFVYQNIFKNQRNEKKLKMFLNRNLANQKHVFKLKFIQSKTCI